MLGRSLSSLAAAGGEQAVYDVAIVGAGMVGAAVAALLRANPLTSGMRLAIIDQQPPPMTLDLPQFPDLRVSTITPANMQLLQRAGAWHRLQQLGAAPTFRRMQVWEHAGPGFISWNAADVGSGHMGCVVENRLLQASLLLAAEAAPAEEGGCLDFVCPGSVQALRLPGGAGQAAAQLPLSSLLEGDGSSGGGGGGAANALARLELADGSALQCRLVVAADGARSRVRQLAGFRTTGWSYHQRGLVATVATSEPSDTAWQRFLPTGPLALLPVRGGLSNVVWTVTPEMARRLEGCSSAAFADEVNAALQPDPATFAEQQQQQPSARLGVPPLDAAAAAAKAVLQGAGGLGGAVLGQLLRPGGEAGQGAYWRQPPRVEGWVGTSPKSFPLQLQHSGRYAAPRLALVGDAAHAIHPMAGQGVNLGLGDAAALADALAHARSVGQDPGDAALLASRYEGPRRAANLRMMAVLELLWRGFGLQDGLAGAARSAGMGLINGVGPLKNQIMRYAMGLA